MHRETLWVACGVGLLCWSGSAEAGYSGPVLFGDSLTDVGNVYSQTFGISPQSPPNFNGRFSNGPLWAEKMAVELNLPAPTPSRQGGRNHAYGGTKTGSGSTSYFPFSFPNIGTQINGYLGSQTPTASQLFVVWGGGNDFIDGQTNPAVPVNNVANHVTALANAGARNVLVPNLVRLGQVPRFRGTASEAVMDSRSMQFNSLLATTLNSLKASLNINIFQLDVEGLFHDLLTNPSAYGFTNTTGTALVGSTPVANADEYVFWDDIHPTRVSHALLGTIAGELVLTHKWISPQAGGSWTNPINWDPAGVPESDWIAHVINDNLGSAQAVAVDQHSSVQHVLVRGETGAMTLIIQSVAKLGAGSVEVQQQGHISLQGGTISTAMLNVRAGGSLSGTGNVDGNVTNAGRLAPGQPGTVLRINGDFSQSSAGRLEIELGGTGSGLHDVLHVSGSAALDGVLAVRLTDNFVALPGQTFLSMTFGSRSGDFTVVNETGFAGLSFAKLYTGTSLTLSAGGIGGDANLDGVVNLSDFNILAANFGQSGRTWLMADFNGDGLVNLVDFNILAAQFGVSAGGAGVSPQDWSTLAATVPEPGALLSLVPVASGFALARRRRMRPRPWLPRPLKERPEFV
jgi:thermolabile hemolysin